MTRIPALEPRFLEPAGWRWNSFERAARHLRFGEIFPDSKKPRAAVVVLQGLGEFAEKYFETARDCLKLNLSFHVIDWMGQGKSGRYLSNPHKRHSAGFEADIADLHEFLTNHVDDKIPRVMLGHSMGGHIGLHYLSQHPETFACAALSAPMIGLKAFDHIPDPAASALTAAMDMIAPESYVFGFSDWDPHLRSENGPDSFSSDPVRRAIDNAWRIADPDLQVGGVTNRWLHEAVKSCARLQNEKTLRQIETPSLIELSGCEDLVSNIAIRRAVPLMKNAKLMEFPAARHEILMEVDAIRKPYLDSFAQMIEDCIS